MIKKKKQQPKFFFINTAIFILIIGNQSVQSGPVLDGVSTTFRITCTTALPLALVPGNADPQTPPQALA